MKVIDIGIGKIGVAENEDDELPKSGLDAMLVAAPLGSEVALGDEISGVTSFAVKSAAKSTKCDYPILCGCTTVFGKYRHVSVMIFSAGKLADIAVRTFNLCGEEFDESDTVKVLRLKRFDLGLLVDTDILLAKNWRRICPYCDAIASISRQNASEEYAFVPTLASLFGKPYLAAFSTGDILWGTP